MKGLGIGSMLAFSSLIKMVMFVWYRHLIFTVCYDVPTVVLLVVLFVTVDVLFKHYTSYERGTQRSTYRP